MYTCISFVGSIFYIKSRNSGIPASYEDWRPAQWTSTVLHLKGSSHIRGGSTRPEEPEEPEELEETQGFHTTQAGYYILR